MASVKINIPYPALEGYDDETIMAHRDSNYAISLEKVRTALEGLGLTMTRPEPQPIKKPIDRHYIVTVPLVRGVTADQVKKALTGFKVEECND